MDYRIRTDTGSPAAITSLSGGTTSKQFALDMETTSPEPCHRISSTSGEEYDPPRIAGRKRVSPAFVRNSLFIAARANTRASGRAPASAAIKGRAKRSKVTIVEMGFPGRPTKYF